MNNHYKGRVIPRTGKSGKALMALLPVIPPLGFLSLVHLSAVRQIPRSWQILLCAFLGSQVLAAVLSPDPLWSVPLALARGVYVIALIATGFVLTTSESRSILIGYGVVAVTAFAASLAFQSGPAFATRLVHPYYTSVSLGLAGTLGLLVAVTWKGGPQPWRLMGGLLSLGMFLWSGSRGPLLALTAGVVAILMVNVRGQWRAALLTLAAGAALVFAVRTTTPGGVTARLMENTLTGRGMFWTDALRAGQDYPWGGRGPYQLGPALSTQFGDGSCRLWLPNERYGVESCPAALQEARGAWLVAHNTVFHLLGETGVIGLTGWMALMAALAVTAWQSRDPLVNGVTWASTAMGLVDNPTLLPSLGHAELYWLLSGTGLAIATTVRPKTASPLSPAVPLMAAVLVGYFTLPAWMDRIRPIATPLPVLHALTVPQRLAAGESASIYLAADVPPGHHELRAVACLTDYCSTVGSTKMSGQSNGWKHFGIKVPRPGHYLLKLQLFDERTGMRLTVPVAEWTRGIDVD